MDYVHWAKRSKESGSKFVTHLEGGSRLGLGSRTFLCGTVGRVLQTAFLIEMEQRLSPMVPIRNGHYPHDMLP